MLCAGWGRGCYYILMQKKITLQNREVAYTRKSDKRVKGLKMAVYRTGEIVVTAPKYIPERIIKVYLTHKSDWLLEKLDYYAKTDPPKVIDIDKPTLKANALKYISRTITKHNKDGAFQFNRIRIKDQKTCWGSCSANRNLNFNYRITLIPQHLAEYIVVHELCHLIELNHSKKFWDLVGSYLPNYKQLVRELKSQDVTMLIK